MLVILYIALALIFVPHMGQGSLAFFVGFFAVLFSVLGVLESLDK